MRTRRPRSTDTTKNHRRVWRSGYGLYFAEIHTHAGTFQGGGLSEAEALYKAGLQASRAQELPR